MSLPVISLVITDLDNTVYDWLTAFVPAFYAMVHEAARLIGVLFDLSVDRNDASFIRALYEPGRSVRAPVIRFFLLEPAS